MRGRVVDRAGVDPGHPRERTQQKRLDGLGRLVDSRFGPAAARMDHEGIAVAVAPRLGRIADDRGNRRVVGFGHVPAGVMRLREAEHGGEAAGHVIRYKRDWRKVAEQSRRLRPRSGADDPVEAAQQGAIAVGKCLRRSDRSDLNLRSQRRVIGERLAQRVHCWHGHKPLASLFLRCAA